MQYQLNLLGLVWICVYTFFTSSLRSCYLFCSTIITYKHILVILEFKHLFFFTTIVNWCRFAIPNDKSARGFPHFSMYRVLITHSPLPRGWVGLWGFLWWAPSAKRKDHHGVSSGWSSVWHRSNTDLSSTQYEQIPIILGVWPFWLTPFFFRSITFWWAYGQIVFPPLKLLSFFWLTYYCSKGLCFSVRV